MLLFEKFISKIDTKIRIINNTINEIVKNNLKKMLLELVLILPISLFN
tara:strand:- start:1338 stop:1481 length:144 start_codon:yes stop_codon:yes gene_type:complete